MCAFDHLSEAEQKALIVRGRALHSLIQAVEVLLSGAYTPKERVTYGLARDLARESLSVLGDEPPLKPKPDEKAPPPKQ